MADPNCQLLGTCTCGWGCLAPRDERVTWNQALGNQWLADNRLSAARANRAWRLAKLEHIARSLALIALSFRNTDQLRNWIWYLADQRQTANRREDLAIENVRRVCCKWNMVKRV